MRTLSGSLGLFVVVLLIGCSNGTLPNMVSTPQVAAGGSIRGIVHGGNQPVTGSTIQLYSVGTTGYGSAPTPLIGVKVTTSDGTGTMDNNANAGNAYNTLPAGSFTISGDYGSCSGSTLLYITSSGGNPGLASGTNNSAILLLAALGPCSSIGSSTYITINEVTTVASVYALAPFMSNAGGIVSIGSYGTTNGGLANAFATVNNLANISTGTALTTTPNGNGVVPQAEINTLANILVPCVNSTTSGSSACTSLLNAADPVPFTVFSSALEIATNPGTNVAALFALSSANAAFQPTLSVAPNDWTVALSFATGGTLPNGLALDSNNNVWIANYNSGGATSSISMITPLGVPAFNSPYSNSSFLNGSSSLAVDANNNVWIANSGNNTAEEMDFSYNGVNNIINTLSGPFASVGLSTPKGVAVDASDNIWMTNSGNNSVTELLLSNSYNSTNYTGGGISGPLGIAMDASGNAWVANAAGGCHPTCSGSLSEISSGGTISPSSGGYTESGANDPVGVAIDGSGHVWITNGDLNNIAEFNSGGTQIGSDVTGGGITYAGAIAIDGSNNVWVADLATNALSEVNSLQTAISPSTGYQGGNLSRPVSLAIDSSGDVWVANNSPVTASGKTITVSEFIGLATPAFNLAQAVSQSKIGIEPGTLFLSPNSNGTWNVGAANSLTFFASGGVGSYTYSMTSGLSALQGIGLSFTTGGTLFGTPTGTGTFPYTVQVSDTNGDTATTSGTLQVNAAIPTVCSHDGSGNSLLKGNYAFLLSGFNPGGHFYDEIGDFKADGAGNITNGNADANGDQNISNFASGEVQYTFGGTYSIGSADNRGIMNVTNTNSGTPGTGLPASGSYCFVADTVTALSGVGTVAETGRIVEADGSGFVLTGYFEIQDSADFAASAYNAGYAFGMQGVDGTTPNRRGLIGQVTLNGTGGVSSGQMDISETEYNGSSYTNTYSAANTITGSGSSYTVGTNGRGTLTLDLGGTPLTFVTYEVATGNIILIMSQNASNSGNTPLLVGLAAQQSTSNFTTANVQAAGIFRATADTFNGTTVSDKVTVGQISLDGAGNAGFVADVNSGGSVSTPSSNSGTTTYTVSSNGYLNFAGTNALNFYLYAPGSGFGLDAKPGVDAYYMVTQTIPSGGFTSGNLSTNLSGSYGVGTLLPSGYNVSSNLLMNGNQYPDVFDASASFSSGTFSFIQDMVEAPGTPASSYVQADQSFTGSYSLDPTYGPATGRFFIQQSGTTIVVGYVVSPIQAFLLTVQPGQDPQLVEGDHQ